VEATKSLIRDALHSEVGISLRKTGSCASATAAFDKADILYRRWQTLKDRQRFRFNRVLSFG